MEELNKVNDKFLSILENIKNSDDYKKYKILENEMGNNKKINSLIIEIKNLQKQAVKLEYDKMDTSNIEKEIKLKLDELNNIPLYVEFIKYQKIIDEEQVLLKEKINKYIENLTND